jgi:hypothetical protein
LFFDFIDSFLILFLNVVKFKNIKFSSSIISEKNHSSREKIRRRNIRKKRISKIIRINEIGTRIVQR